MIQSQTTISRNVRILLLGERGVGKTSLILSLVNEEFPEDVPPKAEEITIPADVTPEQVPTRIVDTSAVEQTEDQLVEEVKNAHVICIVFSVIEEKTLDKVTTKWLPFVRNHLPEKRPIILVGNKVDLVDYTTIEAMIQIMNSHTEIESCVECSAKTLANISEMFYYAQKAVLHPTAPLYRMDRQELTQECTKALERIFHIFDVDNDGLLNDNELRAFQRKCFNGPLKPHVLEDVKSVIKRNLNDGLLNDSITLNGFLFLHSLFIQRGRNETTWTVLRKFGYDEKLCLTKGNMFPEILVSSGCTTELSYKGQKFFTRLFERHDKDKDGALNKTEISNLFMSCPRPAWGHEVCLSVPTTRTDKWITLTGFLCQWTLITLYDTTKTLEYLTYFGYNILEDESQATAIHVTRDRKLDIAKRETSRNVYQCHVIGSALSGKSSFCLGHLGYNLIDIKRLLGEKNNKPEFTINVVRVYGQEKYLVLRKIQPRRNSDLLAPPDLLCDVVCLNYDVSDPKSFSYIADIYLRYFEGSKIPVLVVGTKADLHPVKQDFAVEPEVFCSQFKLPPPQYVSSTGDVQQDIYVKLATMATFPSYQAAWVMFCRKQTRNLQQLGLPLLHSSLLLRAGLGLAAAAAAGFLIMKVIKPDGTGK